MSKTAEVEQDEKRRQHIKEMKEKLQRHCGESGFVYGGTFSSLEQEEKFLEHILFMEEVDAEPLFDLLEKEGIQLAEASTLDDGQVHAKLWEVINGLALLGCYLANTDHLSDRQLYEALWTDLLREPTAVCPNDPTVSCEIDILGGCSEDDFKTRLKYYADEDERMQWEDEFPDDSMPEHEALPYDRDKDLPRPSFGGRVRRRDS